jgi:hypothetical protein
MNHIMIVRGAVAAALVLASSSAWGQGTAPATVAGPRIREVEVQFKKGETGATLKGKLQGDETVDYKIRASAGQSMVAVFKPTNPSAYFNVLPPRLRGGALRGLHLGQPLRGNSSRRRHVRHPRVPHAQRRAEERDHELQAGGRCDGDGEEGRGAGLTAGQVGPSRAVERATGRRHGLADRTCSMARRTSSSWVPQS